MRKITGVQTARALTWPVLIRNGSVLLHLHLSRATAAKLRHVGHVDMTIRLALVAAGNQRIAVDAAASY